MSSEIGRTAPHSVVKKLDHPTPSTSDSEYPDAKKSRVQKTAKDPFSKHQGLMPASVLRHVISTSPPSSPTKTAEKMPRAWTSALSPKDVPLSGTPADEIQSIIENANRGDVHALYRLGILYEEGKDVTKDIIEAANCFRRAAELGQPNAMYYYGVLCNQGKGVPQDYKLAAHWYREAAELGQINAIYNLGVLYYEGQGVPKKASEAIKWYRKAAELGYPKAMYRLAGLLYGSKDNVNDQIEALKWYRRASWKGHQPSSDWLTLNQGMHPYYHLTANLPINWLDLCILLEAYPDMIAPWLTDHEFHEKVGIDFVRKLNPAYICTLKPYVVVAFVDLLISHVRSDRAQSSRSPERENALKSAVRYLQALRDVCNKRDFPDMEMLMDRIAVVLVDPLIKSKNYLEAMPLLPGNKLGQAKLAELLFLCDDWAFPLIDTSQKRYALIAGLLIDSGSKDKEDLSVLSKAITYLLTGKSNISQQKLIMKMEDLQNLDVVSSFNIRALMREFLELVPREHSENYFQYYSMKTILTDAIYKDPQITLFQLLYDLEAEHLQECRNFKPSLYSFEAISALNQLIKACVSYAEPEMQAKASVHWNELASRPLVQSWIKRIPDFMTHLKPLQHMPKKLLTGHLTASPLPSRSA